MRVFISYASEHREVAERVTLGLRNDGHDVFFDRDTLPAGASFDDRIRRAIGRSQLFVFLASTEALRKGAYAQTELQAAQRRWPNPSGHVLPVLVDETTIDTLPPYLRSVSALDTRGDVVADVLHAAHRLARERRLAIAKRIAVASTAIIVAAVAGWDWLFYHSRKLVVEHVAVTAAPQQPPSAEPEFHIDVTLKNRDVEALTVVDIGPQTDAPDNAFSGTSTEWFNLNPDEENKVTVDVTLPAGAKGPPARWRLCWGYVRTEDRYYELETGKADVNLFMGRYRRDECDSWRAWQPH